LAVEWVARNAAQWGGDAERIAIAGDSAGGTLATVAARKARREGISVVFQALFYPSTNISSMDCSSYRQYGEEHLLTTKAMQAFRSFYLPNRKDWEDPSVSPLLAEDEELKELPPALIVTAGCDPLRDEGLAYADKLRACGIPVTYRLVPDAIHGFLNFYNFALFPDAAEFVEPILDQVAEEIRRGLMGKK
jgi:acetyl esterase